MDREPTRLRDDDRSSASALAGEATAVDVEAFVGALQQTAPDLMEQAVSAPGTEVRGRVATSVDVALVIELVVIEGDQMREVWVGISMPPSPPAEFVLPPGALER